MPTTTTTMVDAPTVVVVCVAVVGGTHHAVIRQMMDCVHFWCICHFGLTILCHVHVGALLNCSTVRTSRCLAPSASLFPLPGTASNSSRASFPFPLRPPGSCRGWPPSSSSPSPSPAAYSPASLPPLHLYFDSYLILIQHQNIRFFSALFFVCRRQLQHAAVGAYPALAAHPLPLLVKHNWRLEAWQAQTCV